MWINSHVHYFLRNGGSKMSVIIRSSMLEYLATAHAITAIFGHYGIGASKNRYVVSLIV